MNSKGFLKFFSNLFLLMISISMVAQGEYVIPSGEAVGVKLYSDGLIITSITEVTDQNGYTVNSAFKAGLRRGDRILRVDGNNISTTEEFAEYINQRKQEMVFSIVRNEKIYHKMITPVKTPAGYKIGVWVRDSTAGIGTLSFYNPSDKSFVGLGHGISDIDTGQIIKIKSGVVVPCVISEPTKGQRGIPGELNGVFAEGKIGAISKNTATGILGNSSHVGKNPIMETAASEEVTAGDAKILSDVDGGGVKEYSVKITKVAPENHQHKNLVIEVTDQALISKTGGIVQGMSGAPIIQNNKIVGAVTHVFVNDPEKGYGILIDNMVKN